MTNHVGRSNLSLSTIRRIDLVYMQTNKFVYIYGWFAPYLDQGIRDAVLQTTPTQLACSIF